ncbi:MAG TPA: response regulator transcription factor [Jatrophihabitans sp.]|nr:response regulator transcription factor [Jatrophihabitans sp.]
MTVEIHVDPGLERSIHQRTILVAIENDLVRHGLASMCGHIDAVGDVWTCQHEEQALSLLSSHRPDIVLCQGTAPAALALVQAAARYKAQALILLDDLDLGGLDETVLDVADGFLLRDQVSVELLETAVSRLADDQLVLPNELARALMCRARTAPAARSVPQICLTGREREVLDLLSQGLSNKQIARRLSISEHGVKRHVTNLLAKLNAPNRTLAVAVALQQGLLACGEA